MSLPPFFDPARVAELYPERITLVAEEAARRLARPASEDRRRVAAFGIDCQVSFCAPGGSLFVPGAPDDLRRALGWLYTNLDHVTTLVLSLDAHHVFQIFHPAWWRDAEGRPPAPFTPITAADVRAGRWRPVRAPEASLEYVERLEVAGRYTLTIWPYHCLLGSVGHALLPALAEYALFHSLVRDTSPVFAAKGSHPLTENYSVLSPEVKELQGERVGGFDEALYQALLQHDRVYVFGEASSHCVRFTLSDLLDRIRQDDPSLTSRVYILEDAMSPVPAPPLDPLPPALDFPAQAKQALAGFQEAGMRVVRTSDPIDGL